MNIRMLEKLGLLINTSYEIENAIPNSQCQDQKSIMGSSGYPSIECEILN